MDLNENVVRKIRRGISISQGNEKIVSEARNKISDIIEENNQNTYFKDATNNTFLLPNLCNYPFKFRAYLENDLVEQSAMMHLEQCDRLNWWCDNDCMQRLWPIATTGDGNCLLHAASLAMWGFHDRHLTLRHALHHRLIHDNITFYRRWVYQSVSDQKLQGFTLSKKEFEDEWSEICNLSFPSPKGSHTPFELSPIECNDDYLTCCSVNERANESTKANQTSPVGSLSPSKQLPVKKTKTLPPLSISSRNGYYDFLEQIHVFVLSQVLRRPIIIMSDTYVRDADGQPIQPLCFGGLYLPLLEKPEDCEKSPILLTYSYSHFSALVPMNETDKSTKQLPLAVPLIDPLSFELLPIHFAIDPGDTWITSNFNSLTKKPDYKSLLKLYLNCDDFKFCPHHKRRQHQSGLIREESLDSLGEHQKHSLTRTIGKHIKEKFSHKSKPKPGSGGDHLSPNKRQTINWEKFAEHDLVFGAKLKIKVTSNYNEMIDNYLKNAQADFDVLQNKSRRASIEFMSKVNAGKENNQVCKTVGCQKLVPVANLWSKLCTSCYDNEAANKVQSKQCIVPFCTSLLSIENYCTECYNKFPACKTHNCAMRATDNGYCLTCASNLTGSASPQSRALI